MYASLIVLWGENSENQLCFIEEVSSRILPAWIGVSASMLIAAIGSVSSCTTENTARIQVTINGSCAPFYAFYVSSVIVV